MTVDQFRAAYNTQPFQPFVVHLADGRQLPVPHRDFVWSSPSGRTIYVAEADDTLHIVDLLLVTDIEQKPALQGRSKRRQA